MYQKKLLWLLCATILTSQPVFAQDAAKPEQDSKPPAAVAVEASKPSGFTLDDAIAKALAQSPRLQAFGSGVAAARGEYNQSSALPNPEIGVEAENIAGKGQYKGFDSADVTYGVTQLVEIGGKISARENIAGKGLEIASLEQQAAALDVIRDVTTAYAAAVAAEESVRLASEQKELADDVLKSVSVRVNAAAAPLMQKSRAEVERSTATIAQDKATRELSIARKNLAALMGDPMPVLTLDHTAFYEVSKPDFAALDETMKANPDIAKLESSLEQSKGALDLQKANAIPDPRINVGVRDFRDTGDQAFVVGVSLPIPVFNANRGNIEKARNLVSRNELDNRQAVLNISAELLQARERMENAYVQAETLKTEILPSADKAFRLAREGYGAGRFPYLEVLDAQRSLFGVKQQRIEALREFHTARATVERLNAVHLTKIKGTGEHHAE